MNNDPKGRAINKLHPYGKETIFPVCDAQEYAWVWFQDELVVEMDGK